MAFTARRVPKMKIVVLGAMGYQGRAAVVDLMRSPAVTEVVCADRMHGSG